MDNTTQNNGTASGATENTAGTTAPQKFCKHCGGRIAEAAVICPLCGCQVEELHSNQETPQIVINNANTNTNTNTNVNANPAVVVGGRARDKWVAVLLCLFLGVFGAHKFYEGKIGMGILYLFTGGLCGIGVLIDLIALLLKPNPYFV